MNGMVLVVGSKDHAMKAAKLFGEHAGEAAKKALILKDATSANWLWGKIASGMVHADCLLFCGRETLTKAGWPEQNVRGTVPPPATLGRLDVQFGVRLHRQPFEAPVPIAAAEVADGQVAYARPVAYAWFPEPTDEWWEAAEPGEEDPSPADPADITTDEDPPTSAGD